MSIINVYFIPSYDFIIINIGYCILNILQIGNGPQVINNSEEALIGTDGLPI